MAIKVVVSYSTEDLPVEPQVQRGRGLVEDGASGRVQVQPTAGAGPRLTLLGGLIPLSLCSRAGFAASTIQCPPSGSSRTLMNTRAVQPSGTYRTRDGETPNAYRRSEVPATADSGSAPSLI